MSAEVGPARLGNIDFGGDNAVVWAGLDTLPVTFDVLDSLLHVTIDIEGETRGFGDSETEVESDDTGDASETDEETPAIVDGSGVSSGLGDDGALVGMDDDEGDEGGGWKNSRSILVALLTKWKTSAPKLPKPWAAKVAVIMRPRIRVEANSEEMTAESG